MSLQSAVATPQDELEAFARFCSALTLVEGAPFVLEPFQWVLLADYFDGVIETLVLLPKKNGKTTLLAALALYHLVVTPDAECVIGATSRDQASILYEQATGFVARSEGLQRRVVTKGGYRQIRSRRDGGRIRVLAADVDTADGIIPTLALVDELHRAKSSGLYGVFRDGLGPRDGQMLTISTAGDRETSVLGQMRAAARRLPSVSTNGHHTYARTVDDSFALHEWALEPGEDPTDLRLVKDVNPASWQTPKLLAQRLRSPSTTVGQWARFACGLWMASESWWLSPPTWAKAITVATLSDGDEIAIGFDGSRYHDSTGIVGCRIDDGLLVQLGVWECPAGAEDWEVPTGAVDARMGRVMERYQVRRGYFDPPLWQTEVDGWARDFGEDAVVRYPTNRSRFMGAIERFRTDLVAGLVPHTGDEALSRHVLNAQTREVRGGYWLEKARSTDKIDLAIAAVLAYEARCDVIASRSSRPQVLLSF